MSADSWGRDLRVLLMSPLPDVDPFNGDVIYSRALLEQPPPGVTYVRYDEALASGEVREHGRRQSIHETESLGQKVKAVAEVSRNHTVDVLRAAGALFREPFRFLEIVGSFDLVHCHTFSVNWTGRTTPVLVSNAVPLTELYARARRWSPARVRLASTSDRLLAKAFGVAHIEHGLAGADRVVAFTHTLRAWYVSHGVPPDRVGVVPCFPSDMPLFTEGDPVPGRVGFVGGDFVAKGGEIVLDAMSVVRRHRPDAQLWTAGEHPSRSDAELQEAGVYSRGYLDRNELLRTFLPSCQVFAYPSSFDGLPLTLLEALAVGVPSVVSDYFALPEVVGDGGGGRVVAQHDPAALAEAILELLDPEIHHRASAAARARYAATYAPEMVLPLLRANYDMAIEQHGSRPSERSLHRA
jgi:glycosyltransferase involved in cell wall biosynthesis